MAPPLILQIQQAALNSDSSLTEALRKAKLACTKLGLTDFGNWVELELNGYMDKPTDALPKYRKLRGTPEAYNPYRGWEPIIFLSTEDKASCDFAPIGMSVPAIEVWFRNGRSPGAFEFPYPPEHANEIRAALKFQGNLHIKLDTSAFANILNAVRNILLEWTIEMEKQGVLGTDLMFTADDREKSAAVTAHTVNHFNIANLGALVQNADHSVVQGGVNSTLNLAEGVRDLVDGIDRALPESDLPASIKQQAAEALTELREAANENEPDRGRLRRGLQSLKRIMEDAAGHLVAHGAISLIDKLLV
jgi:hypothetical protein